MSTRAEAALEVAAEIVEAERRLADLRRRFEVLVPEAPVPAAEPPARTTWAPKAHRWGISRKAAGDAPRTCLGCGVVEHLTRSGPRGGVVYVYRMGEDEVGRRPEGFAMLWPCRASGVVEVSAPLAHEPPPPPPPAAPARPPAITEKRPPRPETAKCQACGEDYRLPRRGRLTTTCSPCAKRQRAERARVPRRERHGGPRATVRPQRQVCACGQSFQVMPGPGPVSPRCPECRGRQGNRPARCLECVYEHQPSGRVVESGLCLRHLRAVWEIEASLTPTADDGELAAKPSPAVEWPELGALLDAQPSRPGPDCEPEEESLLLSYGHSHAQRQVRPGWRSRRIRIGPRPGGRVPHLSTGPGLTAAPRFVMCWACPTHPQPASSAS